MALHASICDKTYLPIKHDLLVRGNAGPSVPSLVMTITEAFGDINLSVPVDSEE